MLPVHRCDEFARVELVCVEKADTYFAIEVLRCSLRKVAGDCRIYRSPKYSVDFHFDANTIASDK